MPSSRILTARLIDLLTDLVELLPAAACEIIDRVAGLLEEVGTVCCDDGTIIDRKTIMLAIDRGVRKLLLGEVIPVHIDALDILPGLRIIRDELVEVVILEENDVGEGRIVAGRGCQCDGILDIRGLGLLDDVQLELRILLLICLFCRLECRNVEVLIPGIDRKRMLILCCDICGRCTALSACCLRRRWCSISAGAAAAAGQCACKHCAHHHRRYKSFFHIFSSIPKSSCDHLFASCIVFIVRTFAIE